MRSSRLIVAGIAGVAALGAWVLSSPAPAPVEQAAPLAQAPQMRTTEVLVAAVDIPMGNTVSEAEMKWIAFPAEAVSDKYISRVEGQDPTADVRGSIARFSFVPGEPLTRDKLIKSSGSGFLSAILPPGKKAVAITTEGTGANSAGGFVLPNDYVDVVRVVRDDEASRIKRTDVFKADTVITSVRVLAIGQNVQERNGERFITGQTATLELDSYQAEQIVLAQRVGTLSLALRSLQDASKKTTDNFGNDESGRGMTVVRFGQAQEESVRR